METATAGSKTRPFFFFAARLLLRTYAERVSADPAQRIHPVTPAQLVHVLQALPGGTTMKRSLMRAVRIFVAAPLFVAVAAAWAHAADAPDAWLTMKTKISLMTTEGISTSDLNVDTVQGV